MSKTSFKGEQQHSHGEGRAPLFARWSVAMIDAVAVDPHVVPSVTSFLANGSLLACGTEGAIWGYAIFAALKPTGAARTPP